ncbi:thiopeptide-type bacteriocin biosynthesis protein [Parafrankia elaeagni]|uniref:thiopeptide-type bacteriocin biosynthesis protein n=1 Tax=Parafrankia elaeagni TaxID=222534 RepID=UPI00039E48BE|nr:thiopeptide-type bacteriocin biosynthesis protein [Parafrankia elaeagni]
MIWHGLHYHLNHDRAHDGAHDGAHDPRRDQTELHRETELVDAFLTETLRQRMSALRSCGAVDEWFFVRHTDEGTHVRIRFRGAGPEAVAADLARWAGSPGAGGRIRPVPYEPEVARYGGAAAVSVAERVFCRSSQVALDALDVLGAGGAPGRRVSAALDLTLATVIARGLDPWRTVAWLRRRMVSVRSHPDGPVLAPLAALGANAQGPAVARRWRSVEAAVAVGHAHLGMWASEVRAADAELADLGADPERRSEIWAAQLHMLHNRLGLWPQQEYALHAMLVLALRSPDGPPDFFADGPDAADRRYLDGSRHLPTLAGKPLPPLPPLPPTIPEPAAPPALLFAAPAAPAATLAAPRATPRDRLPRSDAVLGLLTVRPLQDVGPGDMRLRLLVHDVVGLPAGLYEGNAADEPVLIGPPAPAADLAASLPDAGGAPAVPAAVVGVYTRFGELRARCGLRALRQAFLDAGRVAQAAATRAEALNLDLAVVGDFHDDLAQELFLLDGVDEVLACLLVVGPASHR